MRCELVRLYADARQGRSDARDASRRASILAIVGRMTEGVELEARFAELETLAGARP